MAWPFSHVGAPNVQGGPGTVPQASTSVTASNAWIMGCYFKNNAAAPRTVTITNTAGDELLKMDLPPGADLPREWNFRPTAGLKWLASGDNVVGHVWGYE
jgi:hypothetical protein